MPRVSVVIASYNHEKYVAETIQSILDQTYQDFEIVITDDGSTDGTPREVKKFTDPRIKLFCLENNQGACVALRNCIDQANGQYIAVLNSDDAFLPRKLEKQVRFLDEHTQIGAVFGYAQIIDENSRPWSGKKNSYYRIFEQQNRPRHQWLNHFFYNGNCLCHPSILIRRECYEKVGYLDKRLAQLPDLDFWIRLCMKYEIHIIQENLIKFRLRANRANISARKPETLKRSWWEYRHILNNYLKIKNLEDFFRIFPEAREYSRGFDDDLIPFALAMLALKRSKKQFHHAFGLDIIFEMLGDEKLGGKITAQFRFHFIDFIKLTGQYDSFNIAKVKDLQAKQKKSLISSFKDLIKCRIYSS